MKAGKTRRMQWLVAERCAYRRAKKRKKEIVEGLNSHFDRAGELTAGASEG